MPFAVRDRIWQFTDTEGTGTYTLGATKPGYQSFAVIGNGNATYYCVTDGVDWEIVRGVYTSSGTTLSRASIRASSNSNAAVDWGPGSKDVFAVDPASDSFWNLAAGLIKGDGAGGLSAVTITTPGEQLLDDTSFGAMRDTLGLTIGTNVQAYDAELAAIAGLTSAADKGVQFTGAGTAGTFDLTSTARELLNDTSVGAMRTTLELGTAALADIGTGDGDVLGADSIGFDVADAEVRRPKLRDVSEVKQTVAAASTTDIDLVAGNVCELTQNTNITTFTFSNPPASGAFGSLTIIRVKDNNGTTRSIAWPASVDWPGGTAPDLTQTANAVDIFVFFTIDGGTRWHGAAASLDSK